MLIVAALGGNALQRRGEPFTAEAQRHNVEVAADAVAELAVEHQVVVTHGNGPQVGLLALQSEIGSAGAAQPLDVLDAESEGMIGYLLDQAIGNVLPTRDVVTLLTQVIVDADDPAFSAPTKPIGAFYERADADRLARERGWTVAADGDRWRRVVASPEPREIVELNTIESLVDSNAVVICAGGGGIPVVLDPRGGLRGVEAVVDKDASSALLAERLGADRLLLLTDVEGIFDGWGTPGARLIRTVDQETLARQAFAAGSMAPKVRAACRFVAATGQPAVIGALAAAPALIRGEAGTTITASDRTRTADR